MRVFIIGQTMIDPDTIDFYLDSIGCSLETRQMFRNREVAIQSHLDRLIEVEGRLCYKSWEPGLNPNVTKIRDDARQYLHNLIESGHGSVLEHASINFIISGVSRILTHELVRHRAGTAFSQESMRYVRLDSSVEVRDTPSLSPVNRKRLQDAVHQLMLIVEDVASDENIASMRFERKKEITSDLRSFIPMGVLTEIGFSANVRALRHMIEARTAPGAEHEIRVLFSMIALNCIQRAPYLFADFAMDEQTGAWKPLYSKV